MRLQLGVKGRGFVAGVYVFSELILLEKEGRRGRRSGVGGGRNGDAAGAMPAAVVEEGGASGGGIDSTSIAMATLRAVAEVAGMALDLGPGGGGDG